MIEDRSNALTPMRERVDRIRDYLYLEDKRDRIATLEAQSSEPDFWSDQQAAQAAMAELSGLRDEIAAFEGIDEGLGDLEVANELAVAEGDEGLAAEVEADIGDLVRRIEELELTTWFTGEFDHGDALVSIVPGAGGLESQDWAEMLMRMLIKYAESRKWKVDLHDAPAGVELGVDHAVFTVHGRDAYGSLMSENGVHRLVRISPTDEKNRRHTTFAKVEVLPVISRDVEVQIDPEDLRIDVYRSSGPGGQSVNTTDSAVRITHEPTGIVVTCQNEKSQHKNKESAMLILKSRLYEHEQEKLKAELDELKGEKKEIAFGSQIRSYVLYPYQMVKDHRTDIETGDVDGVLSGGLDRFVVGYHRWRVGEETADDVAAIAAASDDADADAAKGAS
jgi:peptide chain release factor 2